VFLVAAVEFQRSVLESRPLPKTTDPARALAHRIEKDRLYAERVAHLAAARGFPVIRVDGTQPVSAILALVEDAFVDSNRFDVAEADVRAARRWENNVVADNIRSWLATPHVPPQWPATYPFACECGARSCDAIVELPLTAYEAAPCVVAPGHRGAWNPFSRGEDPDRQPTR
jgi:hypothetical protein